MKLEGVSHTYTQDVDSCGPVNSLINELEVSTVDAGGGWYVVLKTTRWSLDADEIDAFAASLKALLAQEPKA